MGLIETLRGRLRGSATRSEWPTMSIDQYIALVNGLGYPLLNQTMPGQHQEVPDGTFESFVRTAYRGNGVVFACMLARLMLFSEARFQFRQMRGGRPGDLFGTDALSLLEHPWQNATTGDLLVRMITDADTAGNFYAVRRPGRIKRLRPDWVSIIIGSETDEAVTADDIDAEIIGYIYYPGGRFSNRKAVPLLTREVCHFAPIPDPMASFRGMSWLTPIVREFISDSAATDHKLRFFENGATPNMVVRIDKDSPASKTTNAFTEWVTEFKKTEPKGADAYKTMYVAGGTDVTIVGRDLQQLDFKVVQGAGETRISAASGMHPVIVGLSEGLTGSSLNAGNFGAARRLVADRTMRPMWRNAAGSLATITDVPAGADLWYDDRDISFLREDRKDAAEIQRLKAETIRQLVDAGYEPATVVKAVEAEDMGVLTHTGLFSVQLQPPATEPVQIGPQQAAAMLSEIVIRRLERRALPAHASQDRSAE